MNGIKQNKIEILRKNNSFDEIKEALKNHGFDVEEHETPVIIQQRYFRNSNIKAFENINFILASNDV